MASNVFVRKYSLAASLGFLAGLVSCLTGLLFAIVSRLNRGSGSETILVVCMLLATGVVLILSGINVCRNTPEALTQLFFPCRYVVIGDRTACFHVLIP